MPRVVLAAAAVSLLMVIILRLSGPLSWSRLLGFQNLWVVALGPAFVAVIAGTMAQVDGPRHGGTDVRAIVPWQRSVVDLGWLLSWMTLVDVAAIAVPVVIELAAGSPGADSAVAVLVSASTVVASLVASSAGLAVVVGLAAQSWAMAGSLVVGAVWVVSGVLLAETPSWLWWPSAWSVRAMLPLIGTHANGVSLQGDRIGGAPRAIAASLLAAVLIVGLRVVLGQRAERLRQRDHGRPVVSGSGSAVPPSNPPSLRVEATPEEVAPPPDDGDCGPRVPTAVPGFRVAVASLRRSGLLTLAIAGWGAIGFLCRYRQAAEVASFFGLLVLPLSCAVVPAVAVPRWRAGLRGVALRPTGIGRLAAGLLGAHIALVAVFSAAVVALLVGEGLPAQAGLVALLLWGILGAFLVSVQTVATARWGVWAGLIVAVVGTITGVLTGGGDGLDSLGRWVPWAWGGGDVPLTVAFSGSAIGLLVAAPLAVRVLAESEV